MTEPVVPTVSDAEDMPGNGSVDWVEPPEFRLEPVPGRPGTVRPVLTKPVSLDPETGAVSWEGSHPPEPRPGPVEASVRADLDRLGRLDEGVRGSLAQMALRLARAYDLCADADLAQLARANMELRQTLSRIAEVDDDGDPDEAARTSTPEWTGGSAAVRDPAQSGAADVGAADGGGGGAPG